MIVFVLCLVLFSIGVYCMLAKKNLIKIIIGVGIAECAVNLLFVVVAFRLDGEAPIIRSVPRVSSAAPMVDPLPHALVLTSIVIGLATTALLVGLAMRIHEKYGTFDVTTIRELKG
jgi:multisubunit Na+/H+ antiporter MnhC subunit